MSNKFPYILATKNHIGGYKVIDNEQEATHIVLSVDEYNKIINKSNKYLRENEQLSKDLNTAKTDKQLSQISENRTYKENKELSAENEELKEQLQGLAQECEKLENQNSTLSRINRQNSNKANKKPHPKTNPGYTIQDYRDWVLQYKNESDKSEIVRGHKITLQTPYSLNIDYDQAKEMIENDLLNLQIDDENILSALGGNNYFYEKTYIDVLKAIKDEKFRIAETILQNRDRQRGWAKPNLEDYEHDAIYLVYDKTGKNQEYQNAIKDLSIANAFFGLDLEIHKPLTNWNVTLYCSHNIKKVPNFLLAPVSKKTKKK